MGKKSRREPASGSHSHDGVPCRGHSHEPPPAPRLAHAHSHSHDGVPCQGHGPPQHSHSHDGVPCRGHAPPQHSHSHDGVPCRGHGPPQPLPAGRGYEDGLQGITQNTPGEEEALGRIVHAYRNYYRDADWEVGRWEKNFDRLSSKHKALLRGHQMKCQTARQAIHHNQRFLNAIIQAYDEVLFNGPPMALNEFGQPDETLVDPNDVEKVRYVLKNMVRDWAAEGAAERAQSYGRMIKELQTYLKDWPADGARPRVLIPGCGLARLCVETAALGCEAEGNEFSYFMLLASNMVLNMTNRAEEWAIFPWMHTNCNQLTDASQMRPVFIPDVYPPDQLTEGGLMSMCAGDMVDVYGKPERAGTFDFVLTSFFIDTSHNVIDYIEVIHHVLKEGGVWINLGPLLYHWADAHSYLPGEELSIELSLEDVERVSQEIGFKLVKKEMVATGFNVNFRSMMTSSYRSVLWTMIKEGGGKPLALTEPDSLKLPRERAHVPAHSPSEAG